MFVTGANELILPAECDLHYLGVIPVYSMLDLMDNLDIQNLSLSINPETNFHWTIKANCDLLCVLQNVKTLELDLQD